MAGDRHVFSEQEVGEIIQRASNLQEQGNEAATNYTPGVTRSELERVAKEMGVAPQFLEQAIEERIRGVRPKSKSSLLQEECRVVEGELDPSNFDVILEEISKKTIGRHGPTQIGRTLMARAMSGSGIANVEICSRNGRTRINVKPIPIFEILGTFYPAFIVSMIGGGAFAGHGAPGIGLGIAATAVTAAAIGCRAWLGKSRAAAVRLADKLQGVVSDEVSRQEASKTPSGTIETQTEPEVQVRLNQ